MKGLFRYTSFPSSNLGHFFTRKKCDLFHQLGLTYWLFSLPSLFHLSSISLPHPTITTVVESVGTHLTLHSSQSSPCVLVNQVSRRKVFKVSIQRLFPNINKRVSPLHQDTRSTLFNPDSLSFFVPLSLNNSIQFLTSDSFLCENNKSFSLFLSLHFFWSEINLFQFYLQTYWY